MISKQSTSVFALAVCLCFIICRPIVSLISDALAIPTIANVLLEQLLKFSFVFIFVLLLQHGQYYYYIPKSLQKTLILLSSYIVALTVSFAVSTNILITDLPEVELTIIYQWISQLLTFLSICFIINRILLLGRLKQFLGYLTFIVTILAISSAAFLNVYQKAVNVDLDVTFSYAVGGANILVFGRLFFFALLLNYIFLRSLVWARVELQHILCIISLGLLTLACLATSQRTPLVVIFVYTVFDILSSLRSSKKKFRKRARLTPLAFYTATLTAVGSCLYLLRSSSQVFSIFGPTLNRFSLNRVFDLEGSSSGRFSNFIVSILYSAHLFENSINEFFFGVGHQLMGARFFEFYVSNSYVKSWRVPISGGSYSPHNAPFDVLISSGLIPFLLFVLICIVLSVNSIKVFRGFPSNVFLRLIALATPLMLVFFLLSDTEFYGNRLSLNVVFFFFILMTYCGRSCSKMINRKDFS